MPVTSFVEGRRTQLNKPYNYPYHLQAAMVPRSGSSRSLLTFAGEDHWPQRSWIIESMHRGTWKEFGATRTQGEHGRRCGQTCTINNTLWMEEDSMNIPFLEWGRYVPFVPSLSRAVDHSQHLSCSSKRQASYRKWLSVDPLSR